MPENLTTWKIKTWGMGHGTQVGEGTAEVVTTKNLLLRLQAPRFFVEKDEVVLSANVHNYLESDKQVRVVLELDGATLEPHGEAAEQVVTIAAGGEAARRLAGEGGARGRGHRAHEGADRRGVRRHADDVPVYVHGMLKMDSFSGAIRPDDERGHVHHRRAGGAARGTDRGWRSATRPPWPGPWSMPCRTWSSIPYGCTEQTLNRFLPTVITQKILLDMGLDLAAIRDKRTNLNAQEIGDDAERAEQWKRCDRNPVFDEARSWTTWSSEGLKRLTDMQLSDGGWGWFSGSGERSYPHTTAYVVHGLQIAESNDVALVPGVLRSGRRSG